MYIQTKELQAHIKKNDNKFDYLELLMVMQRAVSITVVSTI